MELTSAEIRAVLSGRYPAMALMEWVGNGLTYSRAAWWYRRVFGAEANLQDAARQEEQDRDEYHEAIYGSGPTMYERELMSMPR